MGTTETGNNSAVALRSFVNESSSSALRKLDITKAADGGHFVFFHGRKGSGGEDFIGYLKATLPDTNYISTTVVDGQPVIVARIQSSPEAIMQNWTQKTGQVFTAPRAEKETKKYDLMKMRGTIGNIGQIFMIISGFRDPGKQGTFNFRENPDAAAKVSSAVISVFGNGINSYYGVQRNTDDTRLKYAKGLVNTNLGMGNNALTGNLPSKYTRITEQKDKPSWMEQNSIKVSNGVKFFGKLALTFASDKNLKLSGQLSLLAKIVTLTGKDEDPYKLEADQSFMTKIRRQSNAISGILEWVANISLFAGSIFKIPKDAKSSRFTLYNFDDAVPRAKKDIQWWQMLGASSFFVSLTAKAMAPFTQKKLDVEELYTHSTIAMVEAVPNGKHSEELTRLAAQLLETRELPELKKQGFATIFTDIANRLEQYHGIAINTPENSKGEKAPVEVIADTPQQAKMREAETPAAQEKASLASTIANQERASTLVERVSKEAPATAAQPSV